VQGPGTDAFLEQYMDYEAMKKMLDTDRPDGYGEIIHETAILVLAANMAAARMNNRDNPHGILKNTTEFSARVLALTVIVFKVPMRTAMGDIKAMTEALQGSAITLLDEMRAQRGENNA
jgi:hypothetical protein